MPAHRTALVVAPTPLIARAIDRCVARLHLSATLVKTFGDAKRQLRTPPDLLITELKLREFNGLHLAVAAGAVPALVIADAAFESEIERLGAIWISEETARDGEELTRVIVGILQGAGARRTLDGWGEADDCTLPVSAGPWVSPLRD